MTVCKVVILILMIRCHLKLWSTFLRYYSVYLSNKVKNDCNTHAEESRNAAAVAVLPSEHNMVGRFRKLCMITLFLSSVVDLILTKFDI